MKSLLVTIVTFFKYDLWRIRKHDVRPWHFFCIEVLRRFILAGKFFFTKRVTTAASALTYSTLLSVVPMVAVLFGVARGFGFNKYIEEWFRDAFRSQPQAADIIVSFVNSYLVHTKSGVFLGLGLLFMLWTVLNLTSNIEATFNSIWKVKSQRSLLRTFTDYLAMFFTLPIVIICMSGITIFMTTIANRTDSFLFVGSTVRFFIDILPFAFMSLVFILLYLFMPNTKVKFSSVIIPGILAGCAMQLLQYVYINSQIFLSSYNAIYGSFAALPLFILWVQLSWTICLFGAELSYCTQNMEELAFETDAEDMGFRYRAMLSAMLLSIICKRFQKGQKAYTAMELKKQTGIPIRVTTDLLYGLVDMDLVVENAGGNNRDEEPTYMPALTINKISVGMLLDRMESRGKWRLALDLRALTGSSKWADVYSERKKYLQALRNIKITDL